MPVVNKRFPVASTVKQLQVHIRSKLWAQVLVAMIVGVAVGALLGPAGGILDPKMSASIGSWLAVPGKVFLALVQMIVIPLVFCSIIQGVSGSESIQKLKVLGLKTVLFFVGTTAVSVSIGLAIAHFIKPGLFVNLKDVNQAGAGADLQEAGELNSISLSSLPEKLVSIIPTNPLGSMIDSEMLQVVFFSVIVGIAMLSMKPEQANPVKNLLSSILEICMTIVRWAMMLAPIAVFGLLAQISTQIGLEALLGMAIYVGTVLAGLLILMVFFLLIVSVSCQKNPVTYLLNIRELLLLAFSTSSSAAVMPLSIQTATEKLGVSKSVADFVVPVGATINMNGTALYHGVATFFLGQLYGIELSFSDLSLVVLTSVGASIGSPATPGVGIVILSMVLQSVGIPLSGVAIIIGVDRILDMSRTALNVTGDMVACTVINRFGK